MTELQIRRLSSISTCNWHNYKDMTAILKSHETRYVRKCIVPIKGARDLIPLAFYLAVTAVTLTLMANNKDVAKAITELTQSVNSMQDELTTLKKRRPTQSGVDDLQTLSGLQNSGVMASDNLPPNKKLKADGDDEPDDPDDGTLVTLSDEALTFLEAAFNSKLDNTIKKGKAKVQGTLNSR